MLSRRVDWVSRSASGRSSRAISSPSPRTIGMFNGILQLPHISRPAIFISSERASEEMPFTGALALLRVLDRKYIASRECHRGRSRSGGTTVDTTFKTVIKVLTKLSVLNCLLPNFGRGGDHTALNFNGRAPHAIDSRCCNTRRQPPAAAARVRRSHPNNRSTCARFQLPRLVPTAPVNAPFSYPNNSLSSNASGIAAQLMATTVRPLPAVAMNGVSQLIPYRCHFRRESKRWNRHCHPFDEVPAPAAWPCFRRRWRLPGPASACRRRFSLRSDSSASTFSSVTAAICAAARQPAHDLLRTPPGWTRQGKEHQSSSPGDQRTQTTASVSFDSGDGRSRMTARSRSARCTTIAPNVHLRSFAGLSLPGATRRSALSGCCVTRIAAPASAGSLRQIRCSSFRSSCSRSPMD